MDNTSEDEGVLFCTRCGWSWRKKKDALPQRCTRCNSAKWRDPFYIHLCNRCGKWWKSKEILPHTCRHCRSRYWFIRPTNISHVKAIVIEVLVSHFILEVHNLNKCAVSINRPYLTSPYPLTPDDTIVFNKIMCNLMNVKMPNNLKPPNEYLLNKCLTSLAEIHLSYVPGKSEDFISIFPPTLVNKFQDCLLWIHTPNWMSYSRLQNISNS